MVTPEERLRERERIAIATSARAPAEPLVSWSGIWAGFMSATALIVVLSALGIAVGISVLDANPASAHDARSWTIGAGLWIFFTFIAGLFVGGMVSTRTGAYARRPSAPVVGACVWVLSIAAALVFGAVRLAMVPAPIFHATGVAGVGIPPAVADAAPDLTTALANGDVDRAISRLADPTVADRFASGTGMAKDRVLSSLADIRGRLEANRADPSRAVAQARADLQALVAGSANRAVASAVPVPAPEPAATIMGWVTFFVLIASLASAVGGAAAGFRPAAMAR